MDKQVLINRIKTTFSEVFPRSHVVVCDAPLCKNEIMIKAFLQRPGEWANKISHNDPLTYIANIHLESMTYTEPYGPTLLIKPGEKYWLAYDSAKLRKRTIKNVDIPKLQKRFEQIRDFIRDNLDKAAHDIAEKVA